MASARSTIGHDLAVVKNAAKTFSRPLHRASATDVATGCSPRRLQESIGKNHTCEMLPNNRKDARCTMFRARPGPRTRQKNHPAATTRTVRRSWVEAIETIAGALQLLPCKMMAMPSSFGCGANQRHWTLGQWTAPAARHVKSSNLAQVFRVVVASWVPLLACPAVLERPPGFPLLDKPAGAP